MRIKVLTTNQRDCCRWRGHNINTNFTHFLLKTFVLSFVPLAKPTIAILNDSTRYQAEPGNADPEALPRL